MTTPAAAVPSAPAIETDNPGTVAITPGSIPPATSEQLLGRVHAKLSEVDASVTGALHKFESIAERILARVEQVAARAAGPVATAASAIAAATPPPVSTVAAFVAKVADAICACGHAVTHTTGGCTAPGCTCSEPPAKA